MTERRSERLLVVATALIATVAAALSIWALTRTASDDAPSYSSAERSAARTTVCQAYDLAFGGVRLQTNTKPPSDQAGAEAAGANARLALAVASQTLTAAVDENPAVPDDLRTSATQLADSYRTVAANYLAGVGNDSATVTSALRQADSAATTITATCRG